MTEESFFNILLWCGVAIAVFVFVSLFFVVAPYGRHVRAGWGPTIDSRLGWLIMESPSVFLFAYWAITGTHGLADAALVLFLMWEAHYVHRTFIWPLQLSGTRRRMPIFIVGSAIGFNLFNSYINGRYLGSFSGGYAWSWLADPRFIVGALVFFAGAFINMHADAVLFRLRRDHPGEYRVPMGGLYRWISCPNYLGEIVEWIGWAIATWSLPGAVFAVWTFANLAPRAGSNHRWNLENIEGYPTDRKALVPYLW